MRYGRTQTRDAASNPASTVYKDCLDQPSDHQQEISAAASESGRHPEIDKSLLASSLSLYWQWHRDSNTHWERVPPGLSFALAVDLYQCGAGMTTQILLTSSLPTVAHQPPGTVLLGFPEEGDMAH